MQGLNEIRRILKRGYSAYLYETYRDIDEHGFQRALQKNLSQEKLLFRLTAPRFLRKQIEMTYNKCEVESLLGQSEFSDSHVITPITLGGLPIWLRIELLKLK